mmetsp:Transcript_18649/g.42793  ORF Transcript_18649/g.42793 Transcript_18649/m.42793 type:complete len:218 (-) Transcript_18649:17-670(-)
MNRLFAPFLCSRESTTLNHNYIVSSMMALTMSPLLVWRALAAFARDTPACDITSSTSLASSPSSSTDSPSSISSMLGFSVTRACSGLGISGALNCSAAAVCAWADKSSIFASPKMMYVSEAGDLKTSGFEMTKRMFFDFLTVTRMMPITGFIPSFCIAFRDFFSERDCFALFAASPSALSPSSSGMSSSSESSSSSSSVSSTIGSSNSLSAMLLQQN